MDSFLVSDFQKLLYFIQKSLATNTAYNSACLVKLLKKKFSLAAINHAIYLLSENHPILKCVFNEDTTGDVYAFKKDCTATCDYQKTFFNEKMFRNYVFSLVHRPFSLTEIPPFKIYLLENNGDSFLLILIHHILVDYKSLSLITRQLLTILSEENKLIPLKVSNPLFLNNCGDATYCKEAQLEKALLLNSQTKDLTVATLEDLSSNQLYLKDNTYAGLLKIVKLLNTTLPILLASILYLILSRILKRNNLLFSFPIDAKEITDIQDEHSGCFINILPTIFDSNKPTFTELLDDFANTFFCLINSIRYPTSKLFEKTQGLSDCIIVNYLEDSAYPKFLNCLLPEEKIQIEIGAIVYELWGVSQQNGQAALHVNFLNFDDKLIVNIKHNNKVYSDDIVENILIGFEQFIQFTITNISNINKISISEIQLVDSLDYPYLLTIEQSKRFVSSFCSGDKINWGKKSIIDLFREQVNYFPDKTAIVDLNSNTEHTYLELDQYSNQISNYLSKMISPGSIIPICIEPSFNRVAIILGILKSYCIFLPISHNEAPERFIYILKKTNPKYLIKHGPIPKCNLNEVTIIDIDQSTEDIKSLPKQCLLDSQYMDHTYLLFTSGSTGKPKGVLSTQPGIVNRILWMKEYFKVTHIDIFVHKTPYTFDVSIWELFLPLLTGAELIIPQNEALYNFKQLHQILQNQNVSIAHFVPSVLSEYIRYINITSLKNMRCIISSGDVLPKQLAAQFLGSKIQLYNLYGPTEASIDVTYWNTTYPPPTESTSVPIGYPIYNTNLYILDEKKQPVGLLESGELYIGGTPLASEYYNDDSLTKERFVLVNVDSEDNRLYRTGDRCRWLPCGAIEFLGRVDREFKFNGQRISPEEIESAIQQCCKSQRTAVFLQSLPDQNQKIIAFIEADNTEFELDELKKYLNEKLPSYMIPNEFMVKVKLPIFENGKTDFNVLQREINQATSTQKSTRDNPLLVNSSTTFKTTIKEIWQDVLETKVRSDQVSFYELGGTSLAAMKVIFKIETVLGIQVSIQTLLEAYSLNDFALRITQKNRPTKIQLTKEKNKRYLATSIQKRIWYIYQHEAAINAYHIPICLKLTGGIFDEDKLNFALKSLVDKHVILRSTFEIDENQNLLVKPLNLIYPAFRTKVLARSNLSSQDLNEYAKQLSSESFDLSGEKVLLLCQLLKTKKADYLIFILHHILFDDLSICSFLSQLSGFYNAPPINCGIDNELNYYELKDSTVVSEAKIQFWRHQFKHYNYSIDLPYKSSVNGSPNYRGNRSYKYVNKHTLEKIKDICKTNNCSPYHFLLTCLSILVSRYNLSYKFFLASTYLASECFVPQDVIGPAFDTLLIPFDFSSELTFLQVLKQTKENFFQALKNAIPYDVMLLELSHDQSKEQRKNLPQLYLNWQLDKANSLNFSGFSHIEEIELNLQTAKNDLAIYVVESKNNLKLIFEYADKFFDEASIDGFAGHLEQIINVATNAPETNVDNFSIYTNTQKIRLRKIFFGKTRKLSNNILLPILTYAEKNPIKIAIEDGKYSLTYQMLIHRIEAFRNYLCVDKNIQPGDIVATIVPKSVDQVIILLAIMSCGAVYLPIDVFVPQQRLAHMIGDAKPKLIITVQRITRTISKQNTYNILSLEQIDWKNIVINKKSLPEKLTLEKLAYLIYTSGSTGMPKGILVNHGSISNSINGLADAIGFDENTRLLSIVSLGFDISLLDILATLSRGGYLYVGSNELRNNPEYILKQLNITQINTLQCTPSIWKLLIKAGLNVHDNLIALSGGEALPNETLRELLEKTKKVWDLYGPTEATVYTSAYQITRNDSYIPIGLPIQNLKYSINDKRYDHIPIGFLGELWISGENTSCGYLNRDELTNAKFNFTTRTYKTGDLVKLMPDFRLTYQGRNDNQVKINGNRVELDEIERVIKNCFDLEEVVVKFFNKARQPSLVAFYKFKEFEFYQKPCASALREILPPHMIPEKYVPVSIIPLTKNGKIDRNNFKMPDTVEDHVQTNNVGSVGVQLLRSIKQAWIQVLGHNSFSYDKNFFDAGGDSFKAALLINKLKKLLGTVDPSITDIFIYPTVNKLTDYYSRKFDYIDVTTFENPQSCSRDKIAVIGLAYKFPGIENDQDLWDALINTKYCIPTISIEKLKHFGVPENYYNSNSFVNRCGLIEDLEYFDYKLFNLSDNEAALLDPQQRHMLMLAHIAIGSTNIIQSRRPIIGTYIGTIDNGYFNNHISEKEHYDLTSFLQKQLYADTNYLASRISYLLNLTGPAFCINTACSSGISAIIAACDAIKANHCEIALAGAVNLQLPPRVGYQHKLGFIFSKTGICSPFSVDADGTVPSSGAGVVVLKPLEKALSDGDRIFGVISGYSTNNDGADRSSYAAPGKHGQIICAKQAIKNAGIESTQIGYIEAHGTGTFIGDAIEISAMSNVYGKDDAKENTYIGSIKANIGHAGNASGLASFIKSLLILRQGIIPPQANFNTYSDEVLKVKSNTLNVPIKSQPLQKSRSYIAINSVGLGGTNCHMILEPSPQKIDDVLESSNDNRMSLYSKYNLKLTRFPLLSISETMTKNQIKKNTQNTSPITIDNILNILSQASEVSDISEDTPLASLDIDSISQLTISTELERYFNVQYDPVAILSAETPRDLLFKLNSRTNTNHLTKSREKLIYLDGSLSSNNISIVFIHPGHGNIDCYKALISKLSLAKHFNFYGIDNPLGEFEYESITQMTKSYFKLVENEVKGSIIFTGWSFGGVIAREINLLRSKENCALSQMPVIMFDSWARFDENFRNFDNFMRKYEYSFKAKYGNKWIEFLWKRVKLMTTYAMSNANDNIILVKAMEILPEYKNYNDEFNHWNNYSSNVKKIGFKSNHDEIFDQKNLNSLSNIFSKILSDFTNL